MQQGNEMQLDLLTLEKMQTSDPIAIYTKAIRAKLGVIVFNPYTMKPEHRLLKGDTLDPKVNIDEITVKIFDEQSHKYFTNANKDLIERGEIVPYNKQPSKVELVNSISDEEIVSILEQPYFTLMNRIAQFTSPVPIERILIKAIELDKGVKTIENIKQRLSELQSAENLATGDKALDKYYKNIER